MALKPLKYSLKHVAMALLLHNAAAGVGTALPPYKHRRGFFARGGGFAIGNTGPSEEIEALAGESFDWLANLGAPAALVAGAVIATMIDQADFLKTTKKDTTALSTRDIGWTALRGTRRITVWSVSLRTQLRRCKG